MLQRTGILYRIISLLGMVAVLAIAWGMDRLLESQREWAAATFNYLRYFLLPNVVSVVVLMALWFGLGWLALFKSGYSRLIWITFLVVGIFFGLGYFFQFYFFQFIVPWAPIRNVVRLIFQISTLDTMRPTLMFIAVLGLLNLALHSRSRPSA